VAGLIYAVDDDDSFSVTAPQDSHRWLTLSVGELVGVPTSACRVDFQICCFRTQSWARKSWWWFTR